MNFSRRFFYLALIIFGGLGLSLQNAEPPAETQAETDVSDSTGSSQRLNPVESGNLDLAGKIVVIPVGTDEIVNDQKFRDFRALLDETEKQKATAVIFEINGATSPDWEKTSRFLDEIEQLTIPIYSFVNSRGTGAGTFVALASKEIYLSKAGIIGAAGSFAPSTKEDDDDEAQKRNVAQFVSLMKGRARSLAAQNGHRVKLVEAFIDSGAEVKIGAEVISAEGEILTLTADEAVRQMSDGKPLIGAAIVDSVEALVAKAGLTGTVDELDASEFVSQRNRERLNQKTEEKSRQDRAENEEESNIFAKRSGESMAGKVVVLKVGIDTLSSGEASFEHMDRIIQKADLDGAEAVIFQMDTPGGYAWYTQGLVLNSLQNLTIPTYTYVDTRAESAGAIIAIGTDTIYMRPAATIGSALVVGGGGNDLGESMEDKVTKEILQMVENVAILKGHNPDVARAFVSKDTEVIIDGTVVHDGDGVLNLNTIRATEIIDGKPVLAKGVAIDLQDLMRQEGLTGELVEAEELGLESFAKWVQSISGVLILIGLAGGYMELKAPGFGLPGLVSVGAFTLFFFGNNMAGNLAGYELVVVFILGIVLIAVEVFLFPGLILPALIGSLMVLGSLVFAMGDRVDFAWKMDDKPGAIAWSELFGNAFMTLTFAMVGAAILIGVAMRFLPESRFGSWMVLKESVAGGASIENGNRDSADSGSAPESYVGLEGIAESDLRPAGKGKFGTKFLDITADGEYIEVGTPLKIVKHEGSRIVVERV